MTQPLAAGRSLQFSAYTVSVFQEFQRAINFNHIESVLYNNWIKFTLIDIRITYDEWKDNKQSELFIPKYAFQLSVRSLCTRLVVNVIFDNGLMNMHILFITLTVNIMRNYIDIAMRLLTLSRNVFLIIRMHGDSSLIEISENNDRYRWVKIYIWDNSALCPFAQYMKETFFGRWITCRRIASKHLRWYWTEPLQLYGSKTLYLWIIIKVKRKKWNSSKVFQFFLSSSLSYVYYHFNPFDTILIFPKSPQ